MTLLLYVFLYLVVAAVVFGWLCKLAAREGRHDLKWLIFVASLLWPLSLAAGWSWGNISK